MRHASSLKPWRAVGEGDAWWRRKGSEAATAGGGSTKPFKCNENIIIVSSTSQPYICQKRDPDGIGAEKLQGWRAVQQAAVERHVL